MSCLPDDIMESVIRCVSAKETWTDLVHSFEGPSDTKENRIMDLKLEYQTFRAKSIESLSQTYTRYKTLLNELANDGVNLSKHEINVGFVNNLPEIWLTFSQGLRNANHTQTLDLADIYGRFVYENNLIQRRYSDTKKALITTPSSTSIYTAFFSNNVIQDFQENSDDKVDERTSDEYLKDLDIEYHEIALLANSKCFIKEETISQVKRQMKILNVTNVATKCLKAFNFTPKLIQTSSNSNNQADQKFQKDYKAEYKKMKPKLALLEASPTSSQNPKTFQPKNKCLVAETFDWDEDEVSDEEEVTQVKVLMALADDELTVGKSHARNDEWVNITMRKVNTLLSMDEDADWQNYLKYINIDLKFVEEQRLNLLTKYNKMVFKLNKCRDELLILKQSKLDAVTFQIQNTELIKLNHALQEELKKEKKINEKWVTSSKKISQCISEKIPHQKKKVLGGELLTESSSKKNENENLFVPASMGYYQEMVPKTKDWVERLNPDSKLLNFNTGRFLVPESRAVNESLETSNTPESSKDSKAEFLTPLPPLKIIQGASPSSEVLTLIFQPHSLKERPGLGIMKHTKPETQDSSNESVSGTITVNESKQTTPSVPTEVKDTEQESKLNELTKLAQMLIDEKVNFDQKTQESNSKIQKAESSKSVDSSKISQDSKPKVQSTGSSKSLRPKPIQKLQLKCELCHYTNHSTDDCYRILYYMICKKEDHRTSDHEINYLKCGICGSYDHSTLGHNRVIQIRGGVLAESSQSNESSIRVKCNTCGSTVHSTSDQNEFDHFKKGEKIQAAKAREPTKNGCSRSMTGVKSYLHKYVEQPGLKFDDKQGTIFNANKEIVLIAPRRNDVYVLDMSSLTPNEACFLAKVSESVNWLWHKRLSHFNFKNINKLAKQNKVLGLPSLVYSKDKPCTTCEKGKHHRASFKTKQNFSIGKCLHLLHMDLFGPVSPMSINHEKYTLVIIDEYSRTDNRTEFRNHELENFCDEKGISQNLSSPYTPKQNGVAEKRNRTLIEAARTMLNGLVLSKHLWTDAVRIAYYTQNRSIIIKRHDKTSYEIFRERIPDINYFYVFGCPMFIHNHKDNLGKFDAKADDGYFLGYSSVSKAFRVYNTRRQQIEETYHVTFDESIEAIRFTNTSVDEIGIDDSSRYPPNEFQVDDPSRQYQVDSGVSYYIIPHGRSLTEITQENHVPEVIAHNEHEILHTEDTKGPPNPINTEGTHEQNVQNDQMITQPTDVPSRSNIEDRWSRDQHIELVNIIGDPSEGMLTRSMTAKLTAASTSECLFADFLSKIEPKKVSEALKHPRWIDAIQEELNQFYRNKVWTLVPLLYGKITIGSKWEEGIDYDETFAPVARMESIRIFLAFATYMNFKVYQIDVKSAFLNGKLKEEVYVKQPPGFESSDFSDYVCKLEKVLYGLKQALKAWYETLSTFLIQNKFAKGRIDNTLFIYKSKREVLLVQVYVDDIIFGSTSYKLCKQFKKLMTKKFEMSMMDELTYFRGLQIKQDDKVKTPMVPPNNLGSDLAGKSVNETSYRGMIGSLICENNPQVPERKSTSGACQILSEKLVCWSAKKQQSVAMSSVEAEFVDAAGCCAKTRQSKPLPEGTATHPKASGGNKQPLDRDITSMTSNEGTAKTTPRPEGSLGDKDSRGNIPPADMEPIHTPVADPSRTGAKYQTSSEVEPDTEPLKLQTYADIQAFLLSDDEPDKDSDEVEVLATGDDMDEYPQDDKEVRTPSPKQDQPELSHAIDQASVNQYYNENIAHRDQTDKLVEASMSSLDRSSTTISDLYKGLNVITQLLKDISNVVKDDPATNQKIYEATETFAIISSNVTEVLSLVKGFDFSALLSTVKSNQGYAFKQEEASTAWMKTSINMAWNLGSWMSGVELSQTALKSEISSLRKDTSEINVTPTLALTDIQANIEGENANTTSTEEPPSHTKRETEEPRLEIPISSVPSTIDKGKGIATDSDNDPSKKLVKASSIVRPDPDEPVRVEFIINGRTVYLTEQEILDYWDKEEQIKKAKEEARLNAISKPGVIKVIREEAKKLGIHPKESITTKAGEFRLKPKPIIDIKIHPKTKPVVITVYRGTDGRNFDVHKPFLFGAFGISELDELREIIPKKKNTVSAFPAPEKPHHKSQEENGNTWNLSLKQESMDWNAIEISLKMSLVASMVKSTENARFSMKLRKLIAKHPDQEKLKSKKVKLEALGYKMDLVLM
ncbi:retrovirus-related pol polyprotein from transposon TNT 1-94 [Tanacetum coccineum]